MLKWLEWSPISLLKGRGGVEVHARAIAEQLKKNDFIVEISSRKTDLFSIEKEWKVVRTHGSSFPLFYKRPKSKYWIHTLHGTTLGRMIACREFFWLMGYLAALRELVASIRCDLLFSVNDQLWIYKICKLFGKKTYFSLNGWDTQDSFLDEEIVFRKLPHSYFVFIGRGDDLVKGVDLLKKILKETPDISLVTIPGTGFQNEKNVIQTGPLGSAQIKKILLNSKGLLLSSYYEGSPIVVSEALALGVPVYCTSVSLLPKLKIKTKGLFVFNKRKNYIEFFKDKFYNKNTVSLENAQWNQEVLPTWLKVTQGLLEKIKMMDHK